MNARRETRNAVLIGAICLFGYCVCYIAKNIVSALQPQIAADGFFDYAVLGAMGTALLLAYGVGQLVNGFLGDHVSPRIMVFLGIALGGVTLLVFPFVKSAVLAVALWAVCGFACSMLGGPMTALIGNSTTERVGRVLLTLLLVASIVGSLIAYLLGLIGAVSGSWRIAFYAGGAIAVAASLVWWIVCFILEKKGVISARPVPPRAETGEKQSFRTRYGSFLTLAFLMMLLATMLCGVLRNAISLWIPTVLIEYLHFDTGLSAAISIGLPIVNFGGTFLSLWLLYFFRNNEKRLCTVFFLLAAACFLFTMLTGGSNGVLGIVLLFAACAAVNGIYNLIFSVYVLRFKDKGGLSGIVGVIDAGSYLAAAGANLLFTALSQNGAWGVMMIVCIVMSVLGAAVTFCSMHSSERT